MKQLRRVGNGGFGVAHASLRSSAERAGARREMVGTLRFAHPTNLDPIAFDPASDPATRREGDRIAVLLSYSIHGDNVKFRVLLADLECSLEFRRVAPTL